MTRIYLASLTVPGWAIDANRHVNNLAYLHWIQEASIAHSSVAGWGIRRFMAEGRTWMVRNHTVDYLRPAFADDRLHVLSWTLSVGATSTQRRYLFWRAADRQVVADARSAYVFVDIRKGESTPIPDIVRARSPLAEPGLALENAPAEAIPEAIDALLAQLERTADLPGIYVDRTPLGKTRPDFQF
ncbi:MAG: acyl-CoA thioesterase [Zoogloeaceae bacterium]|jgi:acyl-CoA thioester hydrolase|nr:acyl-CoA thioesterase [Zoogloeaceae bacterium]